MKLDQRVDEIIDGYLPALSSGQETIDSILDRYPQYAAELRPRLETVVWLLNAHEAVKPRLGFIPSTRKYMEARFEDVNPHGFWQRLSRRFTPQRWAFTIVAPVILLLLLALVINSTVLTARLSIPGDPLYSAKLLIEDIRLVFTFDRVDKANLYMQYSRERTIEFVDLVLDGDYEQLPSAANRMEAEIIASLHTIHSISTVDQPLEQPMIGKLQETLDNEMTLLVVLKSASPPSAHPGIDLAIEVAQSGLLSLR